VVKKFDETHFMPPFLSPSFAHISVYIQVTSVSSSLNIVFSPYKHVEKNQWGQLYANPIFQCYNQLAVHERNLFTSIEFLMPDLFGDCPMREWAVKWVDIFTVS
jgi:hypothetical protein